MLKSAADRKKSQRQADQSERNIETAAAGTSGLIITPDSNCSFTFQTSPPVIFGKRNDLIQFEST